MANQTKWYLHNATSSVGGTLPGATNGSGFSPAVIASGAATNRVMDDAIGSSQVSQALTTVASTSSQHNWFRRWISLPLAAQTISAQTVTLRLAASESSTNSDMFENPATGYIFLWRPSTGQKIGVNLCVIGALNEPGTSQTACTGTGSFSSVSVQEGDVLVFELWSSQAQSMGTAYTNTVFYDGTTEGSTTSNAAHIEFSVGVDVIVATVYQDSATVPLALVPSSTEEYTRFDADTVYLDLQPATGEVYEDGIIEISARVRKTPEAIGSSSGTTYVSVQSFVAPATSKLLSLEVAMAKENNPSDNLLVSVCANDAGATGDTLVQWTIPASELFNVGPIAPQVPAIPTRVLTTPDDIPLDGGVTYWIRMERSGTRSDINRYVTVITDTGDNPYTGGYWQHYTGSGAVPANTNADMYFSVKLVQYNAVPLLKLTPIPGEVYEDGIFDVSSRRRSGTVNIGDVASPWIGAQKFNVPASGKLQRLELMLQKVGSPADNLHIKILTDVGGPSSTVKDWTLPASTFTTELLAYVLTSESIDMPAGDYWITVNRTDTNDASNYYRIAVQQSTNPYSGGYFNRYDSGLPASSNDDAWFGVILAHLAAAPKLTLTPGGTDEYTPGVGGTEYLDSATALLGLIPSGTDERTQFDAATVALALIPSGTDEKTQFDAATVNVLLTPSGTEEKQQYDAATGLLALTPSGTDERTQFDAATAILAFTPSGTDIAEYVESATVPLLFTPGGTDERTQYDADTALLLFTPSGVDEPGSGGTEYLDSNTVPVLLTPSGTDERTQFDSAIVPVALTPSGTEEKQQYDSATVPVLFTPSGTEEKQQYDTATAVLAFTPSGTDERTQFDTAEVKLAFTVSGTEFREGIDSAVATLQLTPSGTDIVQYVEAETIRLSFTPSGTDELTQQGQDQAIVPLLFTPSSVDTLETADSATAQLLFTPSGTEVREQYDTAVVPLGLVPSGTEYQTFEYADQAIAVLTLTPTGVEEYTVSDAATVYLKFTPIAVIPSIAYVLSSAAYLRWRTPFATLRWSTPKYYRRWDANEYGY